MYEYRSKRNYRLSLLYLNISWWSVSSCTLSIDILASELFLGTEGLRTLFSIECQHGKLVAAHSCFKDTEKEVILIPGSYFEVVGQLHPAKDLHIIHLKQIRPTIPLVRPPFDTVPSRPTAQKPSSIVKPNI